jgi:Carboxypeptidase regulatory-like domain
VPGRVRRWIQQRRCVVVITLGLLFAGQNVAQNFRGGLLGTVEDSSGARIPKATVTEQSAEASPVERKTTTDGNGEFRIDGLLPGTCGMTITAKERSASSPSIERRRALSPRQPVAVWG